MHFFFIKSLLICLLISALEITNEQTSNNNQFMSELKEENTQIKNLLNFKGTSSSNDQKVQIENNQENKLGQMLPEGLDKQAMLRSLGSSSGTNTFGFAPNIDISPLLPTYKFYIEQKDMNDLVGDADLSQLEVQAFDLDYKNERLFMPYDQKYKIGDGFNVEMGSPRGSPFYLPAILQSPPKSIEGQDGKVQVTVAISQAELAEKLATQASVWGSGWGISVKASFSYSKNFKMSSSEVILIASHKIDLGKAFIDPSNFLLTQKAQKLLATNYVEFIKAYGTHFLAGATTECSMDVFYKQKQTSQSSKIQIAASMQASYKSFFCSAGVKASMQSQKDQASFSKNTEIEVNYAGANDDAFMTGLTISELQKAVLEFPSHCTGNIAKYILWPYESAQSFIDIKSTVDQIIVERRKKAYLEEIKSHLTAQAKSEEQQKKEQAKQQQQYKQYLTKLENEEKLKQARIQKKVQEAQQYLQSVTLLDEIFTASILNNRITRIGLQDEQVSTQQAQTMQNDDIFVLKSNELIINAQYELYKARLEALVKKKASILDQLKLIKQARSYLAGSSPGLTGSITKITQAKCQDKNCKKCNRYQTSECKECNTGYALTEQKKCTNKCPSGQYIGKMSGISRCIKCNPICKECGKSQVDCTDCNNGYYLQGSTCVSQCKNGYYISAKKCLPCKKSFCQSFNKNKCSCVVCVKGYALKEGNCQVGCGVGHYLDSRLNKCFKCHSFCSQCFGNKVNQCKKCKLNYVLQTTTCQKKCANGYRNKNSICQKCPTIKSCEIYNDNCVCTKCQTRSFLYQSQCLTTCPAHYYPVASDRNCKRCGPSCYLCSNPNYCTKCDSGFKLKNGKCQRILTRCRSYYYLYYGECFRCNHGWARCAGCVEVYWSDNYRNEKWRICTGSQFSAAQKNIGYVGRHWNDEIASIRVGYGTILEAYNDAHYRGAHSTFTSDIPRMQRTTVGRARISSLIVKIKKASTQR